MKTSNKVESLFRTILEFGALVAPAGLISATLMAEPYEITRSTIDGGGVMNSAGDSFELSGTIGQPDTGLMAGGDFELSGGFWFQIAPTDCNGDGTADLLDQSSLIDCMIGPSAGVNSGCACFDVNRDQSVDLRDFAEGQVAFSGS